MAASSNAALSGLRLAKPAEFARKVRAAVEKAGSIPGAAEALGVTRRTLDRWLTEAPALVEGLELPPPRAVERGGKAPAREKSARRTRTVEYLAPVPGKLPELPKGLRVRILVDRAGGAYLTEEDLAVVERLFPLGRE